MSVLLRQSGDLPADGAFASWFTTGTLADAPAALAGKPMLPSLAQRLEDAFDAIRPLWWDIARELGAAEPTARWAHVPTAGSYGSDFGLMLAWSRLVEEAGAETETVLVLCDDAWLFRHLARFPGVDAGRAPGTLAPRLRSVLRGFAARTAVAFRVVRYARGLRRQSFANMRPGAPAMLVYGHPRSRADGYDAYFGDQLTQNPGAQRVLHTDCHMDRARMLCGDGRSVSLHAWGNPFFALLLPLTHWRPPRRFLKGEYGDLLMRSRTIENASGARAINRWQEHCQARWLDHARPARVVWPWENHGWERILVRAARRRGIETVGYQHTVVGRHQFNFSPKSNADGLASIPDRIVCNGPAYRAQLIDLGLPENRLGIGGAIRIAKPAKSNHDAGAPVYVALSGLHSMAKQMLDAVAPLARNGMRFNVKDHPMHPYAVTESDALRHVSTTIPETGAISAVVYTTGTTGLEGLFSGLPTYRLMLKDTVSLDILPDNATSVPVTAETLGRHLNGPQDRPDIRWEDIMSPVDDEVWRQLFSTA